MRAVVIGGGGYMGQSLTKALLSESYEVIVLDLNLDTFDAVPIDPTSYTYVQGNFLDTSLLDITLPGADVVFHLAAVGMTGKDGRSQDYIYDVNVNGVITLLSKCKAHNVKRFVLASSCIAVFTGEALVNHSEDLPSPPIRKISSYYGRSKAICEKIVANSATESFKTCILRFRGVYGPGEVRTVERVVDVIKSGIFVARCQKYPDVQTNHTSISNCIQGFMVAEKALLRDSGPNGEIYNILDAEAYKNYEFWEPLFEVFGKKIPDRNLPYSFVYYFIKLIEFISCDIFQSGSCANTTELDLMAVTNTFSIEKARKQLGYEPSPCMMPEVVKYYRELPDPYDYSITPYIVFTLTPFITFICIHLFNLFYN